VGYVSLRHYMQRMDEEPRVIAQPIVGETMTTAKVSHKMGARRDRPTTEQRRLYEFARSKVREPSKAFVDEYPMPPGWWEFVHNEEAVIRVHSQ
jgi:hypothetical protein